MFVEPAAPRRSILAITTLAAVLIASAVPASGHHSLDASYFMDRRITLDGVLVKIEMGPQSLVLIDVKDSSGKIVQWHAEWVDMRALRCARVDPTVLKAGDRLRLTGPPGREALQSRMLIETITRPSDGWTVTGLKDSWNDTEQRLKCPDVK